MKHFIVNNEITQNLALSCRCQMLQIVMVDEKIYLHILLLI